MQNNQNQKLNRRHNMMHQNFNFNDFSNNQYCFDVIEQGEITNKNFMSVPYQTIPRNPYEQNKIHFNNKNQQISNNLNNNCLVISPYLNILEEELNNVVNSKNSIMAEIEKLEGLDSHLIADRILLIEEVMEKKSNLILLKKEVEVMRGYLNSLVRIKRGKLEEVQKSKINRLIKIIDNINDSTELSNDAAAQYTNVHGIDLKPLEVVNKEILVDLIKNS